MARGGFKDDGLADLHRVLAGHVTRGALPGLVALVARGDHVHVDVIGTKAFGATEPMPRDAVFRIASLTKPVTAAAAMVLVDDGVLNLDDPVDDVLPELTDRRVPRSLGFGVVMAMPGTYQIQAAADALDLRTMGPPWPPTANPPDEWIRRDRNHLAIRPETRRHRHPAHATGHVVARTTADLHRLRRRHVPRPRRLIPVRQLRSRVSVSTRAISGWFRGRWSRQL